MKIIMLKGLPVSGKSSWAKAQVDNGGNYVIVSKDEIRKMFGGYKPSREKDVLRIRNELIRMAIKLKRNVIVDDTNLNPKHERYLKQLARELGCRFEVNDSFLKETPEDCIKRDLHRGEKAVGAEVIWRMYYEWIAPIPAKKLNKDFGKPRCCLVDLDGTLALNLEKRDWMDESRMNEDTIDPFIGCIVDSLASYGVEKTGEKYPAIILVTGRSEESREETEDWLEKNDVQYDKLLMRKSGDKRKDCVVKEELYYNEIEPHYAVLGVIDDRNSNCRMFRKLGLRVLQAGCPEIEI